MDKRIRFSSEAIEKEIIRLMGILETILDQKAEWNHICEESLFELPEESREKLRRISVSFQNLYEDVERHKDILKRVSEIYNRCERKNHLLTQSLFASPGDLFLERGEKHAFFMDGWNGKVYGHILLSRDFMMENWLYDYLLRRSLGEKK